MTRPSLGGEEIDRINSQAALMLMTREVWKGRGKYDARPGRTPLETLEENILTIWTRKGETGNVAKLNEDLNSAVLMATSGARVPWTTLP